MTISAESMRSLFTRGLDSGATVRVRRPGALYQLELPAFADDGDGATVYIRPRGNGELVVTDLGATRMRISYESSLTPTLDLELGKVARGHGYVLRDGAFECIVPAEELVPAVLGLLQLEAVSEQFVVKTRVRKQEASAFRESVVSLLEELFKGHVETAFTDPVRDPDGLFAVDAVVRTARKPMAIALVPNDLDAERAVSAKMTTQALLPGALWLAIPRDIDKLRTDSRRRLQKEYMPVVSEYSDERDLARARLIEFAA